MLESAQAVAPAPKLLLNLKGIGPEFAAVLWSEGSPGTFTTGDRSRPMPGSPRRPGRAE